MCHAVACAQAMQSCACRAPETLVIYIYTLSPPGQGNIQATDLLAQHFQHQFLVQAVLPATCLQLLGLPLHVRRKLDTNRIQADLLQIAAQPSFNHPASALFALQNPFAQCHASSAVYLRPVDGSFSLFSGQTGPDGQPLLNPNQFPLYHMHPQPTQGAKHPLNQTLLGRQPGRKRTHATRLQKGALDICVGDAVSLTVQVHCAFPQPVELQNVALTLSLLQEVTVAYSPKSATSSRADFSRTTSSLKQRLTDSPHGLGSVRAPSGDLGAAADDADVTTQWQETEELACSMSTPTARPPDPPAELTSYPVPDRALPGDTVTLRPGLNTLAFRVLPLKRGLYTLKHMQGSLGSLSLHMPVILREPNALALHSQAAAERPSNPSTAGSDSLSAPAAAALGTVRSTGEVQQEPVVLNVHSCRQRLAVSAAALRGTLVAGQPQWLGIAVLPLHDSLHEACIHVGIASRASTGTDQAPFSSSHGAGSDRAGGSPSVGYAPHEDGSHSPSLDVLHPDRAVIAPLQVPSHTQTGSALTSEQPSGGEASRTTQLPASLQRQQTQTPLPGDMPSGSHAEPRRCDTGAEASVSGSSWVSMEGNQGPNMPPWAATHPSLLWLWVRPGRMHASCLVACCSHAGQRSLPCGLSASSVKSSYTVCCTSGCAVTSRPAVHAVTPHTAASCSSSEVASGRWCLCQVADKISGLAETHAIET